jgi:hypothetical protein
MTKNQWKLLEILEHWGGEGTMEVEIQFGDYRDVNMGEAKDFYLNRLVVANLVRTLVKRGYAKDDEHGYGITEAGEALLQRHLRRQAPA